jgi:hypothetical protein
MNWGEIGRLPALATTDLLLGVSVIEGVGYQTPVVSELLEVFRPDGAMSGFGILGALAALV